MQDTLELVGKYPDQRVHVYLMDSPEFVELLRKYRADKAAGVSYHEYTCSRVFSLEPFEPEIRDYEITS